MLCLPDGARFTSPSWSPDGERMALTLSRDGNPEIYVIDIATRELTRVTNHPAIDTEPRWTADGKALIFTSDRSGGPQIYRVNLASGDTRRLTFKGGFNARGDISPNDRYLAVVHQTGALNREKTRTQLLEEVAKGWQRPGIYQERARDDAATAATAPLGGTAPPVASSGSAAGGGPP